MAPSIVHLAVAVQLGITVLVAIFYLLLAHGLRLEEARLWAAAWTADALAILAILAAAIGSLSGLPLRLLLGLYALGKTLFAVLLLAGTRHHQRPAATHEHPLWLVLLPCALWALALAGLSGEFILIQFGQALMVTALFTWGGLRMLRRSVGVRSRWLGWTVLAEGLVFGHHVVVLGRTIWLGKPPPPYLSLTSFADAGVELLVALAMLLALHERTAEELRWANRSLVETQQRLRELVDQDPLTTLANRRRLRRELDRLQEAGAAVAFLDLDGFKDINDRFGHAVGDACLRRAARLLLESFRQEDLVLRWGGDEFLIVTPGLNAASVKARLETLRPRLAAGEPGAPGCGFSAGITTIEPGGSLRAAIARADRLMYLEKHRRTGRIPPPAMEGDTGENLLLD